MQEPTTPPGAPSPGAPPAPPARRGLLARRPRTPRPHPYADEASPPREQKMDATMVTLLWGGLATLLAVAGWFLARRFSPLLSTTGHPMWDLWTEVPLFGGLALLGFGFVDRPRSERNAAVRRWFPLAALGILLLQLILSYAMGWSPLQRWVAAGLLGAAVAAGVVYARMSLNAIRSLVLVGWLLFAFYWALTAEELFVKENGDYVNMAFALIGVYFFTYLAYHQWLNEVRGVQNSTVRFLNIGTFVAATSYFIIDKIEPIRRWLILTVSDHTAWMLGVFGQGPQASLVYVIDPTGTTSDLPDPGQASLTRFYFSDYLNTTPAIPTDWWGQLMHFNPTGENATIIPVSIILACTALQSIMLFVGLFVAASRATWKKRLVASLIVAAVVYVLNLLRNTGIIWWYGQGLTSFWVVHDAIGKGGSLAAMVLIAFGAFRWFPEFLRELIGVLDLPHRDGPVERTLRLGRRRPQPPSPPAPPAGPPA